MANAVDNMIVGLDIGTSKVVAIVGQITEEGVVEVVGLGSQPSRGMKKGVVVDIEATVRSIQRAVEEAERAAANVASASIRGNTVSGAVALGLSAGHRIESWGKKAVTLNDKKRTGFYGVPGP